MELAFLDFNEKGEVQISREKFGYMSEAFLAAGLSETPNRRKAITEATIEKPYLVKVRDNRYCSFIPETVTGDPAKFCTFLDKCIKKARRKMCRK